MAKDNASNCHAHLGSGHRISNFGEIPVVLNPNPRSMPRSDRLPVPAVACNTCACQKGSRWGIFQSIKAKIRNTSTDKVSK